MSNLFSVIISTTAGREKLLERALRSLSTQIFQDFAVIVISDSDGEEGNDISNLIRKFPTAYFMRRTGTKGPAESRNIGLPLAVEISSYVLFLDDDDSMETLHLQNLAKAVVRRPHDISYTDFNVIDELRDGKEIKYGSSSKVILGAVDPDLLFLTNKLPNNCIAIPTEVVKNIRFDTTLVLFEDWEFLLQCLRGALLNYVPGCTVNVHKTPREVGDRRGARNDDKLAQCTLAVWYKNPAKPPIKLLRQNMFARLGIDLPLGRL